MTINNNQLLAGPSLAPNTIPSAGLHRVTGAITLTSRVIATIDTGVPLAGFGTCSGAQIIRFDGSTFQVALMLDADGITRICSYSVV